jgi:hypothetical protein
MQPIKTTNAMNPAPAKGIESFPTPVIDDVVISEVVNSWKGDYQPLEYGVLWKDVSHAPNQGSFPEHKLVFQQPTSEDGQWIKRIWVNDRVNQDSYNYAIKYSAGSQDHPIYIRTYIVPREGYAPLPDGTPDPLFPGALLVDEEANRNEGELDSKYITVTRVYETLPGPAVPTRRYNERGDLETVIVQTVPPNTPPTTDGLLVTQSQVEQVETGKGVKTTATVQDHALLQIKEKKEGLLGETITTDDIVDPSTSPDALSQTIVASTVEQYTATKARKRTTTASGPTSLSQKSKDGKLLGDITSTESVVAPSSDPDAVSSTIISSEVKQVDSGKAIKKNVVLNSTPTLSGNQNEQGLLGNKSTSESIVVAGTSADPLSLSVISSVVEPIDSVRSRKSTVESSGPTLLETTSLVDSSVGQVPATVSQSIVPLGQAPSGGKLVLQDQISAIDSAKAKRETVTVDSYPELTTYDLEEQLGVVVITEREVVDHDTPYNALPLTISLNDRPIDQWKTLRISSRLYDLPIPRVEYTTRNFTFPSILLNTSSPSSLPVKVTQQNVGFGRVATAVEGETLWVASGANKFISITPNQLRPAIDIPTRFKTIVTFVDAASDPSLIVPTSPADDIYTISTQAVSYSGSLFSFGFGEVLTNGFTISVTASQYDERYKGLNETITIPPSSPTASQYWLTDKNNEKLISWDAEYWRSNIWIIRKTYINLV